MKFARLIMFFMFFGHLASAQVIMPEIITIYERDIVDTTYTYQWNEETDSWMIYARDINYYDEDKNLSSVLTQRWNMEERFWQNYKQELKDYDDDDREMQSTTQRWDPFEKDWINVQLKTTTYDSRGNEAEILYQEWSRDDQEWLNTILYLITYTMTDEKNVVVIKTYSGFDQEWINHQRFNFLYRNVYRPPSEVMVEEWDTDNDRWFQTGRYIMSYNLRGNKTREERLTWSPSLNDWVQGIRYNMSYRRGVMDEQVEQRWDTANRQWVNFTRVEYSYDQIGKLEEEAIYVWDREIGEWVLDVRFLYSIEKPVDPETMEYETEVQ